MEARGYTFSALGAALLAAALLGCTPAPQPLGDADVSLRKEAWQGTTNAPGPVFAGKEPGENKAYPRAFYGAPPMIPHNLDDIVVSPRANDCMDCHDVGDGDTPGIPPSHRIKARFDILTRATARNGQVTALKEFVRVEVVAGRRYDCMLCHAPQAGNAGELVENTFIPVEPANPQEDDLAALNAGGKF